MKKVIYLTALGRGYAKAGMEAGADILRLVTSVNSASDDLAWRASVVARYEQLRIFTPEGGAILRPDLPPSGFFARNLKNFKDRLNFAGIVRSYASKLEEYGPELEKADLLHAWDAAAVIALRKLARPALLSKPLLFTPEKGFCGPRPPWQDSLRRRALEEVSGAVLPGAWACAELKDEYGFGRRCHTLPRGLEDSKYLRRGRLRAELGLKGTDILVCACGRLEAERGFDVLVDAMSAAVREMPEGLFCAIAGTGPQEGALRGKIKAAGLDARVRLLGFREDAGELLADAEIYAAPALRTISDQGLLEAMRAGLAIVASEAGGNPEVLGWGQAGALVPAGKPEALAARIRQIAADTRELVYLSARARDFYVKNHSLRAIAAGAARVYNKALEEQGR